MKRIFTFVVSLVLAATIASAQNFERDTIKTDAGDLEITFIGHATLIFSLNGKVIHVDPWTKLADYSKLPQADLILITHEHYDHLDAKAVSAVIKDGTVVVATETVAKQIPIATTMKNGEVKEVQGVQIEAVPAYNLMHMRSPGMPFHPKGADNGYIVTLGGKRIYIAGDSENTPEMKALKGIDIAFLPMNLPYTMSPAMVADAAKAFRPKILYPYHYGDTDTAKLVKLLKNEKDIEVRIRKMP